jgi:hypothetical protein
MGCSRQSSTLKYPGRAYEDMSCGRDACVAPVFHDLEWDRGLGEIRLDNLTRFRIAPAEMNARCPN